MSYSTYNPDNLGRRRKPYEIGDELAPGGPVGIGRSIRGQQWDYNPYQRTEDLDQIIEDSWQPSPLMRLRQPTFQTQRDSLQELHFPTARELDESLIEDEQFTLVQKVIQSTLDQEDFLPEDIQLPSSGKSIRNFEQKSPIGNLKQAAFRDESFVPFQQLQQNNSPLQDFQPSTLYDDVFSVAPKLQPSTFPKGRVSPMQTHHQAIADHDRYPTVQKFQQPTFQREPTSSVAELEKDQFPSVHENQFSVTQQLRQPTLQPDNIRFLPMQQLRQPGLQKPEFLPLQQLRQPSVPQTPRLPEQPPHVENLPQPRFRRPSPQEDQVPPGKQLHCPSPQPRQPPPRASPPPCVDPKENLSNILETINEEKDIDNRDSAEKSSDKSNHENAMDNNGGGVAALNKRKLSNREWRRRQNESLRRLLAPKNALIVLNEMLPGEKAIGQFKVEPVPPNPSYTAPNAHAFCAELTVDGTNYKGYGPSKAAARTDVAEQVVRDLILKQLSNSKRRQHASGEGGAGYEWGEEGGGEEPLPMIPLVSFALHKLFAEWEGGGHKVPPLAAHAAGEEEGGAGGGARGGARGARGALPSNAGAMQPCMLLAHLRPDVHYRALPPPPAPPAHPAHPAPPYTMAVTLDGTTYSGTGASKKEARKEAARAACVRHFGVTFAAGV